MYTLFIDTHSKKTIIVLYKKNQVLLKKQQSTDSSHSSVLMTLIKELFEEAHISSKDLNEILIVNGPGSFTGIRIGVTVAKTFAFALNINIREIDYFHVLLSNFNQNEKKQVIIPDPKGYYMGLFDEYNQQILEYKYVLLKDFKKNQNCFLIDENLVIDYEKVFIYSRNLNFVNPHAIKPLYIKKIEVEK